MATLEVTLSRVQGGVVMPKRPVKLPDNLPDCHALILQQADRIEELEARVDELNARIDELMAEVAGLRRQLYGSRRERFVSDPPDEPSPLPSVVLGGRAAEPKPPRTSSGR
jgi:hypothetical protein